MSEKESTARVNISYVVEVGNARKKVELPFVMAVMADLAGKPRKDRPSRPVAERELKEVTSETFDKVMAGIGPVLDDLEVADKLTGSDRKLKMNLAFTSMEDFRPERLVSQVPELAKLYGLRRQLDSLLSRVDGKADVEGELAQLMDKLRAMVGSGKAG